MYIYSCHDIFMRIVNEYNNSFPTTICGGIILYKKMLSLSVNRSSGGACGDLLSSLLIGVWLGTCCS
jgi:hypothetical protein